jgi:DNA processing protein
MTDPWLRLAFAPIHPERMHALLEVSGSPEAALRQLESEVKIPAAEACRTAVTRWGGTFESTDQSDWSDRFGHVVDPPRWLFREGTIGVGPLLAIVGTRRCTEYGRRIAFDLASACAATGWGVVSGLARGIDGAAHRGAIAGSGVTIAVLGAGPDIDYPAGHGALRQAILRGGGAVVTEYPPGAAPLPWRFPPRNRIISGLAAAVVVVESGESGGSLSTAARAVAQARPVLAVPGDVDREASIGCNRLIRDGAIPVLGPEDLAATLAVLPS